MSDPYEALMPPARLRGFRTLLEQELASLGAAIDDDQRGATMPDGAELCFDNLARVAASAASSQDMAVEVQDHLIAVLDTTDVEDLDEEAQRAAVRVRLVAEDSYGLAPQLVRPFAEGVDAVIAVDLPETTLYPGERGELLPDVPDAQLWDIAMANTEQDLRDTGMTSEEVGGCYFLQSDSSYTTGIVCFFPEVLQAVTGRTVQPPGGLLLAIPDRHTVVVGFVDVIDDLIAHVQVIAPAAYDIHAQEPGAISPDVFYWDEDGIVPIASIVRTGAGAEIDVQLPDQLQQRLAGPER